MNMVT